MGMRTCGLDIIGTDASANPSTELFPTDPPSDPFVGP